MLLELLLPLLHSHACGRVGLTACDAGKHGIEPPSDGTLADLGRGQSEGRRKMFKRIGTDMDTIVSSYGLG